MRYHTITVLSVMGLAAVFGCSSTETRSSRTTITHNPPTTAATTSTMKESDMRPMLSDANILAIIEEANTGEVQEGQLAQQRASNPQVRLFASKVTQDHRALLEQSSNLASRMNITPSLPRDSRTMTVEHQAVVDSLKAKSGEAFDRAYLEHQIQTHETVLRRLDEVAMDAQRSDLRSFLAQVRPGFQAHLKEARDLQRNLTPMPPGM
jgi:putative membrane protein